MNGTQIMWTVAGALWAADVIAKVIRGEDAAASAACMLLCLILVRMNG